MSFNRKGLEKIQSAMLDLAERKNNDYSNAIDNIGVAGDVGLVVRMFDKVSRLMSLVVFNKDSQVKSESIRDTAGDLINYSTFLVSVLDGTWNKPEVLDSPAVLAGTPVYVIK